MKSTMNYGLNKPDITEFYDVNKFNENMDIVDGVLKSHDESIGNLTTELSNVDEKAENAQSTADTATKIAKGRNQSHVFATTDDMYTWLSNEANKGVYGQGDNIYIVELDVPDWWIAEVLEEPNENGYYYEIAQLETQKVDLTEYDKHIVDTQTALDGKMEYFTCKNTEFESIKIPVGQTGSYDGATSTNYKYYIPKVPIIIANSTPGYGELMIEIIKKYSDLNSYLTRFDLFAMSEKSGTTWSISAAQYTLVVTPSIITDEDGNYFLLLTKTTCNSGVKDIHFMFPPNAGVEITTS